MNMMCIKNDLICLCSCFIIVGPEGFKFYLALILVVDGIKDKSDV